VKIEFLYEPDCSSTEVALARLREVMLEEGCGGPVVVVEVHTDEQANALRFPGSPTIRIDDRDIDPMGVEHGRYLLTCRLYRLTDGRITPFPSEDLIRNALRSALAPSAEPEHAGLASQGGRDDK
jgi:hypothetical protein